MTKCLSPCEKALLITELACQIVNCYSDEEAGILSADLVQLGDTIIAILANKEACNKTCE